MCHDLVMQIRPTESRKQVPLGTGNRFGQRAIQLAICSVVALLTSCSKPLDMSGESITPPGPEWGVVIGSILVQRDKVASDESIYPGREPSEAMYEFDIVPIQPGDPEGTGPYVEKYRLDAKLGEERTFVSRLRSGRYLVRSFRDEHATGLGGELNIVFSSMGGEIRYIGRLVVEMPQDVAKGKRYRYRVENAHKFAMAQISSQHAMLTEHVVDALMERRTEESSSQ